MRGPAELRASHEVLEFVRDKPGLSLRVMQLRDAGMSWLRVQEVLKAAQVKDVLEARSMGGGLAGLSSTSAHTSRGGRGRAAHRGLPSGAVADAATLV